VPLPDPVDPRTVQRDHEPLQRVIAAADRMARELVDTVRDRPGWAMLPLVRGCPTAVLGAPGYLGGSVQSTPGGWWWSAWAPTGAMGQVYTVASNYRGQPMESALGAVEAVERAVHDHQPAQPVTGQPTTEE
jgi:hypothetical protein